MSKAVQFSENQIVYSSQDDERYRVPIGGNTADIMDWIDNEFAMYADDEDAADAMDDAIKEQEEYYHTDFVLMSRTQMLATAAKIMEVVEVE